jgi:hypothetical protein
LNSSLNKWAALAIVATYNSTNKDLQAVVFVSATETVVADGENSGE